MENMQAAQTSFKYFYMFLPLNQKRVLSNWQQPPPPDTVSVFYTEEEAMRCIQIINTVHNLGIPDCMPILMNHLTPNSSVYRTDMGIEGFRYIWSEAQFNFIWIRGAQNISQNIGNIQGAEHAVIFSITCAAPFQTFLLAYLLLRFVMENILVGDINLFEILGLTFRYHEHGVLGVMIFGSAFTLAVNHRRCQAKNGTDEEYFYVKKTLCSRWIRPETTWTDQGRLKESEVVKLMKNGRRLANA